MKSKLYVSFFVVMSVFVLMAFASVTFAKDDETGRGMEMSAQHQSAVSAVIEKLTELVGKDDNIGEEVRAVAQEQQQENEHSTEAIGAVETRGKFRTFLFGTDYKNIGVLRSTVATTENHINRLEKAKERTTDDAVKADIDAQISALQAEKMNVEIFIQDNESKFSLLGWFVKLFQ